MKKFIKQATSVLLVLVLLSTFTINAFAVDDASAKFDKINVVWQFVKNGVYSEENPAATVEFTATALDEDNNPVSNAKLYFKSDVNEVSFTNSRVTDENGVVTFKYAYALDEGVSEKNFTAQISNDKSFSEESIVTNQDINVVLQKKSDLVLYTNQVKASRPNATDGEVINVDDRYEYFTGALHQGAIDTSSGEWKSAENGNISNLAPGQYALRWRERVEGNTIYLHSNYNYFTIERATWNVKANVSDGVTVNDDVLYSAPGGDVFYYVNIENGYQLSDYSVDKTYYISDIYYDEDEGYIHISGITGNVTLTINAQKIENTTASTVVKRFSAKIKALSATAVTLDDEQSTSLEILNVTQDASTYDGSKILVEVGAYDSDGNSIIEQIGSDKISLKYKTSSAKNYSTGKLFSTDYDKGTATYSFSVSANKEYSVYAVYDDVQSDIVSVKTTAKPTLSKNNLTSTPEYGDKSNGTITIDSDYNEFTYNLQGNADRTYVEGNVITGLQSGTWYVYIAPKDLGFDGDSYNFRLSSSSTSITVGKEDDVAVTYTVKFVNANGDVVSSKDYDENTSASKVAVPDNTPSYTDGNKVYTYSWGTISNVTADVTYSEIETVTEKEISNIEITNIYQNDYDGNKLSFDITVTDDNGNSINNGNISVYSDGSKLNGKFVQNSDETYTFESTNNISVGEHTVYAKFSSDDYIDSQSSDVTVALSKAQKPTLEQTPDKNSKNQGSITITSDYSKFAYYRQGESETVVEDKTISNLLGSNTASVSSDYYVYVVPQKIDGDADYNFVTASDKAKIKVENIVVTEYTVTVYIDNNNSYDLTFEYDNVADITAPEIENKYFSHWAVSSADGEIFSSTSNVKFLVKNNLTLYAVYTDEQSDVTPITSVITSTYRTKTSAGKNAVAIVATRSVPDGYTVKETGIKYATNKLLGYTLGSNVNLFENEEYGADRIKELLIETNKKSTSNQLYNNGSHTLIYGIGANTDAYIYALAYTIAVNENGEEIEFYSDPISFTYNSLS